MTLVLSLVAFNLVAATSKIPDMPYLNVFDWFIFTAYVNAISVLLATFAESIYIGHFMGFGQGEILKAPRSKKLNLITYPKKNNYDVILLAVNHDIFLKLGINKILTFAKKNKIIFDVKNMFPEYKDSITLWEY